MRETGYYLILQYLREQKRPVSPHELAMVLQKSRVTVQSSLKRLLENGWVRKEGRSPKVFYRALELRIAETAAENDAEIVSGTGLLEEFVRIIHGFKD